MSCDVGKAVYCRPRKIAQLIERVKEEWASIDQETTNDFGREFSKKVFWSATATMDVTVNTENHSTFEKPVSLTHCSNKFIISYL